MVLEPDLKKFSHDACWSKEGQLKTAPNKADEAANEGLRGIPE
jgi:hypothetical protein